MEKPFKFIECKISQKDQFQLTEGHQPTYALLFIKKGSFLLKMNNAETVVGKNECAIFSDDINFFRTVIEPIHFVYLQFQINPKCPFNIPIPFGKVEFKNKERFMDSIKKYEELMDAEDSHAVYYREHLLEDILLQAYSENNQVINIENDRLQNCHDATVNRAVEYIRENLAAKLIIKDICINVCTNPSTLNFKFRKELLCSVGDFITEERMKKAKHLLSGTSYTIGEIASRCGFENIYYFSTAFRKTNGISPISYRNQYR